jgi:hypothetical protein
MSAWGPGAFENDAAGDFAEAVCEGGGLAVIEDAFDHVLEAGDEDLESTSAEEAVAAAAIVARLKDGTPLADTVESWIAQEQPIISGELVAKARNALQRVMTAPSELLELWQDADEFPDFQAGIDTLLKRLG